MALSDASAREPPTARKAPQSDVIAQAVEEAGMPLKRREFLARVPSVPLGEKICLAALSYDRRSMERGHYLSILSNYMHERQFAVALGSRANELIADMLTTDVPHEASGIFFTSMLHALRTMSYLTPVAQYRLLNKLAGSPWAKILVDLSGVLLTGRDRGADAHTRKLASAMTGYLREAIGLAAVSVLVNVVLLPKEGPVTAAIDEMDLKLRRLRTKIVGDLLDAGLPRRMNQLLHNAYIELLEQEGMYNAKKADGEAQARERARARAQARTRARARVWANVNAKANASPMDAEMELEELEPVPAEYEAAIALRGIASLAVGTNLHQDVREAFEAEMSADRGLLENLSNLMKVTSSYETKKAAMNCLCLICEDFCGDDFKMQILDSDLPALIVEEVGNVDAPMDYAQMLQFTNSTITCLYTMFYSFGQAGIAALTKAGAVLAIVRRAKKIVDAAEKRKKDLEASGKRDDSTLDTHVLNVFFYCAIFLRHAALVCSNECEVFIEAGLLRTLWRIDGIFKNSNLRTELATVVNSAMEVFEGVCKDLYHEKLLEFGAEKNDAELQERARRSQVLACKRKREAGEQADVSLPERPPQHFCPISKDVMVDPVLAGDGFAYERIFIERWLKENATSPTTNAEMPSVDTLMPAHTLRQMILEWEENAHDHNLAMRKRVRDEAAQQKMDLGKVAVTEIFAFASPCVASRMDGNDDDDGGDDSDDDDVSPTTPATPIKDCPRAALAL